jgi:AcrR family transcriptional regulator
VTQETSTGARTQTRVETRTRKKEPKQEIREAAERLWSNRGFHATGIQELCEEVSMGRGSLYYHIQSKEDLLLEISLHHLEKLIDDGKGIIKEKASSTDLLYKLSQNLMRNISDHKDGWTVFFSEIRSLNGERKERVLARRAVYENIWVTVMERGVLAGEFRETSKILVKGMLGMHNYSYLWLEPGGNFTPEQIGTIFMNTILDGIHSPSAT